MTVYGDLKDQLYSLCVFLRYSAAVRWMQFLKFCTTDIA